jgi:hypothetical protein
VARLPLAICKKYYFTKTEAKLNYTQHIIDQNASRILIKTKCQDHKSQQKEVEGRHIKKRNEE